jgi:hypothetical protein
MDFLKVLGHEQLKLYEKDGFGRRFSELFFRLNNNTGFFQSSLHTGLYLILNQAGLPELFAQLRIEILYLYKRHPRREAMAATLGPHPPWSMQHKPAKSKQSK